MPPSRAQQTAYRPSDEFLQRIDGLRRSSPDFPTQLASLFREKASTFTRELQSKDKEWLIEYLDNVLSALDPGNRAYRECLDQLGWACFYGTKLPQSQILDVSSLVSIPNPTRIGPYEACYEGSSNNSKVCVKKFIPSLARQWNMGARTSCFRDVVKWKYLTHSNVVPFLGITNKPTGFVSAWIPGTNLTSHIVNHPGTVNPLDLFIGIVSGLEYLHSRNVVHGDLGGPNIIIGHPCHPRITNFGLGAVFPTNVFDEVRACKRWASPEALRRGVAEYRVSTDIFSFAMVIVEVFTGKIPFFPETDSEAQSTIIDGGRPARPTHPDLTDKLWDLVERCWNVNYYGRPGMLEVVRVLHDCRSKSMEKDGQTAPPSRRSRTATQNSTRRGNEPLGVDDTPKEDGSDPSTCDENTPILPSAPPPAPTGWFSQITNEILDLTDQVASVALFGPIGVGKSFNARATLDNDRTRATFGDNCYFICCDDLENSPDSFIQRLSEAIHVDVAQLQSRLESSPPLVLVLDGVDSFLDPPTPEAEEVRALIEEFGSYEHVCLLTTSRIYPNIQGFHRINITPPPEDGARDMFHSLCDLGRSSTVDTLIAKLDFHPLSIKLLTSAIRENNWDEMALLKAWDDQASALRETYYQKLKEVVEPVFLFPTIKNLGDAARDVLGAIAAFPSGLEEHQLGNIFRATGPVGGVVDELCKFSLVSRQDGFVRMLSPFRSYFLESMLVFKIGEDVKWGPDCMPAKAWLPVHTEGPPEGWSFNIGSRPIPRKDVDDSFPRATPVFTVGPSGTGSPHTPSRRVVPARETWIRRLPEIIKQSLLALFGRRIKPPIHAALSGGPAGVPPIDTQEGPTDAPPIIPQDSLNASSTPTRDLANIPPTAPQNDPTDVPDGDSTDTDTPLATTQPQLPYRVMPGAYEV